MSRKTSRPEIFTEHLNRIQREGFETLFVSEYVAILQKKRYAPRRAVVITFDDQHAGVVRYAVPLLAERGMRANFFVVAGSVSEIAPVTRLTWNDLKGAIDSGVLEVHSHSYNHVDLTQCDDASLEMNLAWSKSTIEKHLGVFCSAIAYPYGYCNERVCAAVHACGYESGFTIGPLRFEEEPINFYALKRLGVYIERPDDWWIWALGLDVLPPLPSAVQPELWRCYR